MFHSRCFISVQLYGANYVFLLWSYHATDEFLFIIFFFLAWLCVKFIVCDVKWKICRQSKTSWNYSTGYFWLTSYETIIFLMISPKPLGTISISSHTEAWNFKISNTHAYKIHNYTYNQTNKQNIWWKKRKFSNFVS